MTCYLELYQQIDIAFIDSNHVGCDQSLQLNAECLSNAYHLLLRDPQGSCLRLDYELWTH